MSKYIREPNEQDFLEWATLNANQWKEFYEEHLLGLILDLEMDDYFGTEGFDKRFA